MPVPPAATMGAGEGRLRRPVSAWWSWGEALEVAVRPIRWATISLIHAGAPADMQGFVHLASQTDMWHLVDAFRSFGSQ